MKIIKKSYSYGMKRSKNYQSVDVNRSIEVQLDDNSKGEIEQFEALCNELKLEVVEQSNLDVALLGEAGKVNQAKLGSAGVVKQEHKPKPVDKTLDM